MGATSQIASQDVQDARRSVLQRQGPDARPSAGPVPKAERKAAAHVGRNRHERHRTGSGGDVPKEVS